jgi:ribosomal protein S18 acetylase RimI-like enzyme
MSSMGEPPSATSPTVTARPLQEKDVPEAKRIFHLAFGTFLGLDDPMEFWPDRDYIRTRYIADPSAALAAEVNGELVGSNFVVNWGSVGFFGPLTIRPDYWDRGVAKRLLERTMEIFAKRETKHAGLFTFAQSAKHVGLYQKFGFWPRFLTVIMSTEVRPKANVQEWMRYSDLSESDRVECLRAARDLTNAIYDGMDITSEILTVAAQKLGDTVLLWDDSKLSGLAVCHCGANTEAGNDAAYIKFGAVRPGTKGPQLFDRLLDACQSFAMSRRLERIEAGVNLARHDAYQQMLARGFRTALQGVAMHKPNESGYSRSGVYVIDDWR